MTAGSQHPPDASTTPSSTHPPRSQPRRSLRLKITIESTFATVRLRTKVTKGHGSKAAGLAMAFKLIESAQRRWRMVNAPHLVALVRGGATFINGKLVERPAEQASSDSRQSPAAAGQESARAA